MFFEFSFKTFINCESFSFLDVFTPSLSLGLTIMATIINKANAIAMKPKKEAVKRNAPIGAVFNHCSHSIFEFAWGTIGEIVLEVPANVARAGMR